jgi:Flp pilus assembly protein TadD
LLRTAAIIKNLDLLITIDTAVAHLAGAMGVPVWVALPLAADWRWLRDREDSPWYPQMRLFRQQWSGEWTGVFGRIAQSLREKMADKAPVDTAAAIPRDCQRADELLQEGNKQIGEGRIAAAQESFKQALLLDSLNPSIHHDLGVSFAKQGMLPRAIACFRRSLELAPQNANAYANLGLAFLHNEQIDEAVAHLQKAIFLGGGSADVHNNLGVALMQVPDPVAAAESYRRALYLKPDYAAAHYNLARALLIQGDFVQGWLEYEWRYDFAGKPDRHELDRRWAGQRIDGKTLLLHAEQEIEDVIQFARYIPHIKRRGPTRIVLACPAPLVMLMHGCSGLDQVFVSGGSLPHFDLQARLMSLPGILETTLETIPTPIPYIHPDPAMAQAWKARLESLHGFKVGIAWQGNPQHRGDRQRSVPLEQFKILSQIEGVKLVSLQRGAGCEQIEKLKNEIDLETFQGVEEEADGLLRTAAIIKNLDLLITIDTAVAHLAGAMGVPAWVALPLAADWRWLRDREDSPWYPHMRLFRQHRRNDWTSVFEAIALELQKTAPAPSPPMPRRKTDETVPRLAPTAPPAPEAATSVQSTVQSILPVRRMLQSQFDVGVVMTTIMRPTLKRAVQSIFAQRFLGRIQILLGIDKCKGDMAVLNELQQACPQNCALTVLDLGYSTAARNGGLYPSMPGGALRTILSYAANCRRLAYLDDDNWYAESHLQSLSDSLDRNDWAYSLRWYVDRETQQPLCIDRWESVGPGRGVYATNLGGYVDPNCLMIDKIVCESVLRWWCFPVPADRSARSEDRQVFRLLKERSRVSSTGQATVYYTIHPSDALHAHRTRWISETVHEPLTDDAKPAEAAR